MTRLRYISAVATVLLLATTAAACGIPAGPDSLEDITDEVPARITDTTSPTTTTIATTVPPVDPTESTILTTTTVEPAASLVPVRLFFLSGDLLVGIEVEDEPPIEANLLRSLLEQGPASAARDNFITAGLINNAERSGGTVTIDLDERRYNLLGSNRYRAVAQIVLTYLNNLDAVGLATFTIDGELLAYPGPNGFLVTRPVSVDDYANLLVDTGTVLPTEEPPDTTTTSTTTTTTTTEPEPEPEPTDSDEG